MKMELVIEFSIFINIFTFNGKQFQGIFVRTFIPLLSIQPCTFALLPLPDSNVIQFNKVKFHQHFEWRQLNT